MNTDQIAYLIDIAKTGSINTTAKRMFSSQQAVSESIKRLEKELNCVILERSKRGVSLTEDGRFVLQHMLPMMEQYHLLQQHFQKSSEEPSGKLHIGVAMFASNILLTDLIFEMYRHHPYITLFTEELSMANILHGVLQKKIDFGLASFSDDTLYSLQELKEKYSDTLEFHPLYTDHIVCVMHRNNPWANAETITQQHIQQMKFTCYNHYQQAFPSRWILHMSSNTAIHKRFMKEENAVCMINWQAYHALFPEKEYVALPVDNTKPVTISLFCHKQKKIDNQLSYQSFIDTALTIAKNI